MVEKKPKTQNQKLKTTSGTSKSNGLGPERQAGSSLKASKKTEPKPKKVEVAKQEAAVKVDTKQKTISVDVIGREGAVVGKVELPSEIFGTDVNEKLIAQAVRVYLSNQRQGNASTKTRGEVRGSTRKIYRQKGTGRARHGAIRAPIFVGGGIVFGPRPRDFSLELNKQMRRKALFSALSYKLKNNEIRILDSMSDLDGKTKSFAKVLKNLNLGEKAKKTQKLLFVITNSDNSPLQRAARNIEGVSIEQANLLNTYEVVNNNFILLVKDAVEALKKTFLKS